MFASVSKAAIRHRRIEVSNLSPSAQGSRAPEKGTAILMFATVSENSVDSADANRSGL
jgi:hypothetical protein